MAALVMLGGGVSGTASASCAGPPPGQTPSPPSGPVFVGRLLAEKSGGTAGTLYEFDVESVQRGSVPARAVVDIAVNRVIHSANGATLIESSSIAIGGAPAIGGRYRVDAYIGTPGGRPRMFVNACGGSLERLAEVEDRKPMSVLLGSVFAALAVAYRLKRRATENF